MRIAMLEQSRDRGGVHHGLRYTRQALEMLGHQVDIVAEQTRQRYDLVWFSNFEEFCRRTRWRCPTVMHLHGWCMPRLMPAQVDPQLLIQLQAANILITTSRALAQVLDGLSPAIVHNGVDVKRLADLRQPPRRGAVTMCLRHYASNWDYLALTFINNRGLSGKGPQMRVINGDRCDHLAELAQHALYIHFSNLDSCPLSILEAMALGLPVIAQDAGDIREIVGDAGIVVPDLAKVSAPELVREILGKEYPAYRARAITRAEEEYTIPALAKRLGQILTARL